MPACIINSQFLTCMWLAAWRRIIRHHTEYVHVRRRTLSLALVRHNLQLWSECTESPGHKSWSPYGSLEWQPRNLFVNLIDRGWVFIQILTSDLTTSTTATAPKIHLSDHINFAYRVPVQCTASTYQPTTIMTDCAIQPILNDDTCLQRWCMPYYGVLYYTT